MTKLVKIETWIDAEIVLREQFAENLTTLVLKS